MSTQIDPGRSRFAEPPVFEVVGHVEQGLPALVAAGNPRQARAPKGSSIGGQWIDAVLGMIRQAKDAVLNAGSGGTVDSAPGTPLVESVDRMYRPELSPGDVKKLRSSYVSGEHIDENGEWTPERKAWQEEQVENFLQGVEPAAEGEGEVWFNGGGPGSGKGGFTSGKINAGYPPTRGVNDLTGEMDFAGMPNPGAVLIDPDSVKMQFPEVKRMRQSQVDAGVFDNPKGVGGNWADQSHEESSYIAKMIYAEAQKRNLPIVYDGTGTNIVGKAKEAKANGYGKVNANYMYVEADQALASAIERAGRIGRNVPPDIQADQYREMPDKLTGVIDSGVFDTVNLWDRNGLKQGDTVPKIFEIRPDGTRKILDEAAYARWLTSGDRVPDVG